jgi:signal transduction histidine kinase
MLTDTLHAPLVLLVEDDENHAELMKMALQDAAEEYRLERVGSLEEARHVISKQTPDLVLTDYRLPDGDGSELVSAVNGLSPVILLTCHGNEQTAVDAMKAGAQDYVVKTASVFSGISRVVQRGIREWALIQEQKRNEEERHRMQRHLLHVQKLESLGTMSGGIAHDFNNLLQSVLGNLELSLMKLPQDTPVRKLLDQASIAAERAAKLSSMMLAYSGKGIYALKEHNLTELIEHDAALLVAAVPKNITFDIKLHPVLPKVMIDADQIQQVIMNIVINASEAIDSGNGLITLATGVDEFDNGTLASSRLEEKPAAGRYVWLEVSDSGCGMDAATRDKLFDPFFTTKFTGRGLGMSAAQGIVCAHKGAILVESSPGAGTTIKVLFPLVADLHPEVTSSRAEQDGVPDTGKIDTILIVEDEDIIREVSAEMCRALGFAPLTANGGLEALQIFRELGSSITLVLLDYSMPGMDGVTLFSELRKEWPKIPVLLASGYGEEEIAERFKGVGLDGFIQKPFNLSRLGDELKRVLSRSKG